MPKSHISDQTTALRGKGKERYKPHDIQKAIQANQPASSKIMHYFLTDCTFYMDGFAKYYPTTLIAKCIFSYLHAQSHTVRFCVCMGASLSYLDFFSIWTYAPATCIVWGYSHDS